VVAIRALTAVAALIAAGLWLRSASIHVADDIDKLVDALTRIGYWNSMAAYASCAAATLGALDLIHETFLRGGKKGSQRAPLGGDNGLRAVHNRLDAAGASGGVACAKCSAPP
jgi:hypothetical protein